MFFVQYNSLMHFNVYDIIDRKPLDGDLQESRVTHNLFLPAKKQ